jgi:hypothetical protein
MERFLKWQMEEHFGDSFLTTKNRHLDKPDEPSFILIYRSQEERDQGQPEEIGWHVLEHGWETDYWIYAGTLEKAMKHCEAVQRGEWQQCLDYNYPEG